MTGVEEVSVDSRSANQFQFNDETPATKPTRELPADASRDTISFVETLDSMYSLLDDPEMFSAAFRNIMVELAQNPQYEKQITDEDVRTALIGMRRSMGLSKVRKADSKAKRAGSGAKKSTSKISSQVDELMAGLDSLGLDLDFD